MTKKTTKPRRLIHPSGILDFRLGIDRVVRRGQEVFVVDPEGIRAEIHCCSDEVTEFPGFVARLADQTDVDRLLWQAGCIQSYAFLSAAGKRERLQAIAGRIIELSGRAMFEVVQGAEG